MMRWADETPEQTPAAPHPQQPPPQPTKEEVLAYAQEVMHLFKAGIPFDLAYNMPAHVRAAFVTVIKVGI
jgi:hypothetical protein